MALQRLNPLPILPLANEVVLLPGVVIRIAINGRPDIPAILSHAYSRATKADKRSTRIGPGSMTVGCVPASSPLLNQEGHSLLEGAKSEVDAGTDSQGVRGDLFGFGTLAKLLGVEGKGTGELAVLVEGVSRFKVEKYTKDEPFIEAEVIYHDDNTIDPTDIAGQRSFAQLKQLSREFLALLKLSSLLPRGSGAGLSPLLARRLDLYIAQKNLDQAGLLADFMSNLAETSLEEKLQILATWDLSSRLEKVIEILSRQVSGLKGNVKVAAFTSAQFPAGLDSNGLNRMRRDSGLRRGQRGIPGPHQLRGREGDDGEDEGNELEELKRKLEEARLSPEAQKVAKREMKRLEKMNPAQAEYQVCRNYLETLSEIPWSRTTEDQLGADTLARARRQLDDDHYGLEKIKKRLIEYLAVLKLKQTVNAGLDAQIARINAPPDEGRVVAENSDDAPETQVQLLKNKRLVDKSPILLLVGPPGTGKTSLAQSVAAALGRKFHRISLGGVRDEAEIRGHRRTYVAAMPGLIINGLKKVGVANPVFLLDEIDKVGTSNFHGDPSAAMLEVLDPEQNHTFSDHYVNIPVDLSKVLFIATANTLDTIPAPLLDRMETIALSGYTALEKRHIASQHLIPKQITSNGLRPDRVSFTESALDKVITSYTRESGVRNLEREIGSVCRYKAVQFAEAQDASKLEQYQAQVSEDDLEDILGIERFDEEIAEKTSRPGIVTGLVAYSSGGNGSILFIEVADMPGSGRVQLTGKLGDVLKESVEVALTWVKAHSFELGLSHDPSEDIMKNRSVHVHCPSGAIPKDGPSAGLAHTIALISLFSGKAVPPTIAMTGEVSLRGRVMPVGGIKEKLIGALRAGVKTVLLPAYNRKDIKDLPQEVRDGLDIIHVGDIWEGLKHIWPEAHWPGEEHLAGLQARL